MNRINQRPKPPKAPKEPKPETENEGLNEQYAFPANRPIAHKCPVFEFRNVNAVLFCQPVYHMKADIMLGFLILPPGIAQPDNGKKLLPALLIFESFK